MLQALLPQPLIDQLRDVLPDSGARGTETPISRTFPGPDRVTEPELTASAIPQPNGGDAGGGLVRSTM